MNASIARAGGLGDRTWGRSWLVLATLIAGCNHAQPFQSPGPPQQGPRTSVPPIRLTYNLDQDLAPTWKPDGSGVLYIYGESDRSDHDRCIGLLPARGGTRIASKCYPFDAAGDSTDVFEVVAAGPDGRIAWIEAHSAQGEPAPSGRELRVGTLPSADRGTVAMSFPFDSPSGQRLSVVTHLAWLGADLVFVGAEVAYSAACTSCPVDTLVVGGEVDRVNLAASPPTLEVIPGTDSATSVWPTPDGAAIYYTVRGDSRVYRRDLVAGTITTIHDFTSAGIVRDVAAGDSTLTAVVGGKVSVVDTLSIGPVQVDSGGFLHHLDLRTSKDSVLDIPGFLIRHPVLSPDGASIVAEVYPDLGSQIADLWLFQTP